MKKEEEETVGPFVGRVFSSFSRPKCEQLSAIHHANKKAISNFGVTIHMSFNRWLCLKQPLAPHGNKTA